MPERKPDIFDLIFQDPALQSHLTTFREATDQKLRDLFAPEKKQEVVEYLRSRGIQHINIRDNLAVTIVNMSQWLDVKLSNSRLDQDNLYEVVISREYPYKESNSRRIYEWKDYFSFSQQQEELVKHPLKTASLHLSTGADSRKRVYPFDLGLGVVSLPLLIQAEYDPKGRLKYCKFPLELGNVIEETRKEAEEDAEKIGRKIANYGNLIDLGESFVGDAIESYLQFERQDTEAIYVGLQRKEGDIRGLRIGTYRNSARRLFEPFDEEELDQLILPKFGQIITVGNHRYTFIFGTSAFRLDSWTWDEEQPTPELSITPKLSLVLPLEINTKGIRRLFNPYQEHFRQLSGRLPVMFHLHETGAGLDNRHGRHQIRPLSSLFNA